MKNIYRVMVVLAVLAILLSACGGGVNGCHTITQKRGELRYNGNDPTPYSVTVVYWLEVCYENGAKVSETSGSYDE